MISTITPILNPFAYGRIDNVEPNYTSSVPDNIANQQTGFPLLQAEDLSNPDATPVKEEEMNGVLNFYTNILYELGLGQLFTFDQELSDLLGGYSTGAMLWSTQSNSFQRSLINNNTFNFVTSPSYLNDGIHWISDFTNLSNYVYTTVASSILTLQNQVTTLNGEIAALQNATTSFYFDDTGTTKVTSNITSFGTNGYKAINMSGTTSIVLTNGSGGVTLPSIQALTNGRASVLIQNNVIGTATLFDEPAGGRIIGIITAPTSPAFTVEIIGASGAPTGTYTVSFSCTYTGF